MRIHLHDAFLLSFILTVSGTTLKRESPSQKSTNTTLIIPSPMVVPPSQYWDGVDGLWSTFALRVGTPAQDVRVLVSTNSPETLVALPLGCTSAAINPVPNNCANSRGGLFNPDSSSSWQELGLFGINQDGVGFEADLGYSQNAEYGLETLGLGYDTGGANELTLKNQTVAGFATSSPFYLGVFGLGTQPVNYSTIGNFSTPSFFSSLRSQQLIPSLSWSFTAGAKYRLKAGQYAQLIFGGFDTSRFTQNSATFTLNEDINRDIVVAIQSITYSGTTQSTLLPTPAFAFIESTDPNLWLPEAACQAFEQAFGLSIDKSTGLYLMNTTHYTQLLAANPQVTFTLANSLSGGQTVNIVLPFSSFALSASYPFTPNNTYYFPLKKAANDSQNTLGRVFLQEAYLTVDYERGNFSVSQCVWQDGATQQISAILSPSFSTSSSSSNSTLLPSSSSSPSKPLGVGVIAGGVGAGIVVLGLAIALAFFIFRRRRRARPLSKSPTEDIRLTNINTEQNKDNKDGSIHQDPNSPFSTYKKMDSSVSVYRSTDSQYYPDGELGTSGEIYQLPTHEDQGDYYATTNKIASERRAASTAEIDGRVVAYELQGSDPTPVEMDDASSRAGLSPSTPMAPPWRDGASAPPSPLSAYSTF